MTHIASQTLLDEIQRGIAEVQRLTDPDGTKAETPLNGIRDSVAALSTNVEAIKSAITDEFDTSMSRVANVEQLSTSLMQASSYIDGGVTNISLAVRAGRAGDTLTTTAYALDATNDLMQGILILGTAALFLGAGSGPVAVVIGGICLLVVFALGVVSAIIKCFLPDPIPLIEEIERLLRKIGAENQVQSLQALSVDMASVIEDFQDQASYFGPNALHDYLTWEARIKQKLNFKESVIQEAAEFLMTKDNQQKAEGWDGLLSLYLDVELNRLMLYMQAFARSEMNRLTTPTGLTQDATAERQASLAAQAVTGHNNIAFIASSFKDNLSRLAWPSRNLSPLFTIGDNERFYFQPYLAVSNRDSASSGWIGADGEHDDFITLPAQFYPAYAIAWHNSGADTEFLISANGQVPSDQNTWVHPRVASKDCDFGIERDGVNVRVFFESELMPETPDTLYAGGAGPQLFVVTSRHTENGGVEVEANIFAPILPVNSRKPDAIVDLRRYPDRDSSVGTARKVEDVLGSVYPCIPYYLIETGVPDTTAAESSPPQESVPGLSSFQIMYMGRNGSVYRDNAFAPYKVEELNIGPPQQLSDIRVTGSVLWGIGSDKRWLGYVKLSANLANGAGKWTEIPSPLPLLESKFQVETWHFVDIFAGDDGMLIATIALDGDMDRKTGDVILFWCHEAFRDDELGWSPDFRNGDPLSRARYSTPDVAYKCLSMNESVANTVRILSPSSEE